MATFSSFRLICLSHTARRARRLPLCTSITSTLASTLVPTQPYLQTRKHSSNTLNIRKRIFDDKIPHSTVHVLDTESNRLGPPQSLSALLSNTDLTTLRIELISTNPHPVVRIISRRDVKDLLKLDKAKAKEVKKGAPKGKKQIQATWGVADSDLMRKVVKARGYIESGYEVAVVLSKKKGVPLPPKDIMVSKLDEIAQVMGEVAKEQNRSIGSQLATISFQRKAGVQSTSKEDEPDNDEPMS